MLRAGGSAADAAIATSAVLAVTTPHMCGMGGDLFALVHDGTGAPTALNSSGRAGSGADADRLRAEGADDDAVPPRHPLGAGARLRRRLARAARALRAPRAGRRARAGATCAAADGFAVVGVALGHAPARSRRRRRRRLLRARTAGDRASAAGDPAWPARSRPSSPTAATGSTRASSAPACSSSARASTTPSDLEQNLADWVDPLERDARSITNCGRSRPTRRATSPWPAPGRRPARTCPPIRPTNVWPTCSSRRPGRPGHDRDAVLAETADPRRAAGARRASRAAWRRSIRNTRPRCPGRRAAAAPIYLCAVDADGMGVSLIQSNAADFGAHLVEPRTGIFLHNRGIGFSLDGRPSRRVRPGSSPAVDVVARAGHPARRFVAGGARHHGRRRAAAGGAAAARPPAPRRRAAGISDQRTPMGARQPRLGHRLLDLARPRLVGRRRRRSRARRVGSPDCAGGVMWCEREHRSTTVSGTRTSSRTTAAPTAGWRIPRAGSRRRARLLISRASCRRCRTTGTAGGAWP